MAQGLIKESKLGQPKGKKPTGVTKKGKRTIAPKRASLVKNAQLIKVRIIFYPYCAMYSLLEIYIRRVFRGRHMY